MLRMLGKGRQYYFLHNFSVLCKTVQKLLNNILMCWCCCYVEGEQKSDDLIKKNKVLQAKIVFWCVKPVCGFWSKSTRNVFFGFSRMIEGKGRKFERIVSK